MPLSRFHPIIQTWFKNRFQGPTEAQEAGWPAIAQGRHTLIAAPTGSGKTLAAFLTCIDGLVRLGIAEGLPDTTQVVYVSPLKALSNDIQKNLATPLEEMRELAEEMGTPLPEIRTAVRTGDTKPSERQRMAKRPPHILITTPESLYILLTSRSGRKGLQGVKTLILDEIHAVANNKRGSHLSLSVERLRALAGQDITCIGLSATQRPIEEMARLLVGNDNVDADGVPDCLIVDTGHSRTMDLAIELPQGEMGPIATHEIWGETLDTVAGLVREHDTTLMFVNTRRLVERLAHQLSERLGEDAVVAHHGSLSRATRLAAEEKLRKGEVKVCVATASLELGIDVGVVDLVCQIGSPRSIGLLLQRVGRSGHTLGGTPKGRLFPLTRDELLECTALMRALRRGNLDSLTIPPWPLDVLAQQMVAACSAKDWDEEELFQMCKRAYPYRELPREKFDQVVEVLSQGFAPREGRGRSHLHHDGINRRLTGRRGAGIAAMTGGGAIPDNADYDVIADPEETFVGTVNEDFAIESLAGDVFLLGNTPWKIRRVESGRVRVEDAQGLSPTVPFWLGEAPGRTWELSQEVTSLREEMDQRLDRPMEAQEWVAGHAGVSPEAARQLVAYLEEGKRVLGMVPTGNRVVAERFFDESGGMQIIVHAPFGARINRAWGMALRKRICRSFDFELQASATDDGLNFSLGPNLSFPLSDIFTFLSPQTVEGVLRQAMLQAPLFGTRWRWNATRALAVLRHTGGRKVPAPLLRMRSDDLLASVFPAQVACQDNALTGDIEEPDHPIVFETMRDCLTEATDLPGLIGVLEAIREGDIQIDARDTVQPSVFAHQILNAAPYAFLDDAPLEERRARAVSLRRALPEDSKELGSLDALVIQQESDNAWPRVRDVHELHDALLVLGILPQAHAYRGDAGPSREGLEQWFAELVRSGRAFRFSHTDDSWAWAATERLSLVRATFPDSRLEPSTGEDLALEPDPSAEEAHLALVRGWVECSGPFTPGQMAQRLGLGESQVNQALLQLESEGLVLRGRFHPDAGQEEFCDRRILARIHRATISGLRQAIEPVSQATFMRFLFQWQHAQPDSRLHGEGGLLDIIEQLQGFEGAAGAWEGELFSSRMREYQPSWLDQLCLGGEVVWGRMATSKDKGHGARARAPLSRSTRLTFARREDLEWLLDRQLETDAGQDSQPAGAAGEVLGHLDTRGACFLSDLIAATHRMPSDVEEALWQLAAAGRVTSDGVEALRSRISGNAGRARRSTRFRSRPERRRSGYSRWSVLQAVAPRDDAADVAVEWKARQLLLRYGILFPELLVREPMAPRWRDMVRLLRRLEARGEIRGGRFVAGFIGEQFALPEAVEALRKVKGAPATDQLVAVSACDPLNLVGIVTPGERVPGTPGNMVVFRDGVPLGSLEKGRWVNRGRIDQATLSEAWSLLHPTASRSGNAAASDTGSANGNRSIWGGPGPLHPAKTPAKTPSRRPSRRRRPASSAVAAPLAPRRAGSKLSF